MENERESLGKYISILYRYGQCFITKELQDFHIGSGQYIFLIYLFKNHGIRQEELSHMLNIDKGTTARAIKKLEEQGYIERKVDMEDKRAYKIFITEKAMEVKKEIYFILEKWNEILSLGLSEEEKNMSLNILKKMCENIQQNKTNSCKKKMKEV